MRTFALNVTYTYTIKGNNFDPFTKVGKTKLETVGVVATTWKAKNLFFCGWVA